MPSGIYIRTDGHNKKISEAKKGKKRTEETKRKIREATKGEKSYWFGRKHTEEELKKISEARRGEKHPLFGKRGKNSPNFGKKRSEKSKKLMSEGKRGEKNYWFGRIGENSSNWKGGITPKNKIIRKSIEFRLWREAVFARDNWTCQKCKIQGGKLHPHHIQNFAQYPELQTSIENGITFCKSCHRLFHKMYGYKNNTREQVGEFQRS